jgi:hypothetical protein
MLYGERKQAAVPDHPSLFSVPQKGHKQKWCAAAILPASRPRQTKNRDRELKKLFAKSIRWKQFLRRSKKLP